MNRYLTDWVRNRAPGEWLLHPVEGARDVAASDLRVPFWEVVSDPGGEGEWHDLAGELPTVVAALQGYGSQLVVDGSDVVHVGGQRQPIQTRVGVRQGL